MSRLIDADKLKAVFCEECMRDILALDGEPRRLCRLKCNTMKIIDNAPTVDAVEVVRCKDCKFAHLTADGEYSAYCDMAETDEFGCKIEQYDRADHFCSYGERRTE